MSPRQQNRCVYPHNGAFSFALYGSRNELFPEKIESRPVIYASTFRIAGRLIARDRARGVNARRSWGGCGR